MELITAKCPDCGAGLKIPEGSSSVICEFCGSQVMVTDVLGSGAVMQNCMILAYAALESNDYKEAYDHFNRALEIDMKSSTAWFGKAMCTGELGKVANPRFDEMMSMFENALKYAPADKQENLKKNAAAEVVKCVRHITPNLKFAVDMLEIEMGDKDADMAASMADISANLKKTKDEITRALQKSQEYDPANKDLAPLITEVNAFNATAQNPGIELNINQDFADAQQKLSQVQVPGVGQANSMNGPAAQTQTATKKKSGCTALFVGLFMFLLVGTIVFFIAFFNSKPSLIKTNNPVTNVPQVTTKTEPPTQSKQPYWLSKYSDFEGRMYYSVYADLNSDEDIQNVSAAFIRDYSSSNRPYTVNMFREKTDAVKNGFPQVKHNESWIIRNAESIGLVAKLEFGNPKSEIEIVKYINGKSVEVN